MYRQYFNSKNIEFLESGLLADATITCGDRTWNVHKFIIYRCEWFKKAFNGNFEEAQTNNVKISAEDFSPELVDCVISFLYSGVFNIEKLNTNDSMVDACVRLWVIADFLVLKELQNEAVIILEEHCDEKLRALCSIKEDGAYLQMTEQEYDALLTNLFRGVETAYTDNPLSVPCQQILISFFHAVRKIIFGDASFISAMSKAPTQFSHELLIAVISGRASKWTLSKKSEYHWVSRTGNCTFCNAESTPASWAMDPSMSELTQLDGLRVLWRCGPCIQKHGFKRARADGTSGEN